MFSSLPDPNKENVSIRSVEGGFAAVLKFSGKPTEDIFRENKKLLRSSVLSDGLKPKDGCLLAPYNDPGRTKSFMMVCMLAVCTVYDVGALVSVLCLYSVCM
ncbi:putative SOUL heme-binding protein [Helianthus annuus]|nr:putative SOUL heme-binding protein [Helianthus annuus]